jgi:hypothetical protein
MTNKWTKYVCCNLAQGCVHTAMIVCNLWMSNKEFGIIQCQYYLLLPCSLVPAVDWLELSHIAPCPGYQTLVSNGVYSYQYHKSSIAMYFGSYYSQD